LNHGVILSISNEAGVINHLNSNDDDDDDDDNHNNNKIAL